MTPTTTSRPKNVLVVGMPRSGTSLSASIFAGKDYFITPEEQDELNPALRTGDEGNPSGYWEAESLIEHNVEILNRAGFAFHNTRLFELIQPDHVAKIYELEASVEHRAIKGAVVDYFQQFTHPKSPTAFLLHTKPCRAISRSANGSDRQVVMQLPMTYPSPVRAVPSS